MKSKEIQEFKETEIGKIPVDWEVKKLGEVTLRITDGKHGDCENEQNSGYYFLSAKDVIDGQLQYNSARQITKKDFEEVNKRTQLAIDDILITNSGTIGRLAIAKDQEKTKKTTFQKSVAIVKPKKTILNNLFLYYYFLFSKDVLSQTIAVGTSQPNLLLGDLRSFEIPLPNLECQINLSTFLHSFDLQINSLKYQNKLLEQISQAIFKSWFVDFDGVTEFEDSELGKIPKGWKITSLDTIVNITMGQSPPGISYNSSGKGVVFYQGNTDFGEFFPIRRIFCTEPKRFAEKNDVLFTVRAPVGSLNVSNERCCIGRGLACLRLKENHGPFLLYFMKSLIWKSFESEGTVFGSIKKNDFEKLKIIQFPPILINQFNLMVQPMYKKIWGNNENILVLVNLRDSLLPKLMSGEIRV